MPIIPAPKWGITEAPAGRDPAAQPNLVLEDLDAAIEGQGTLFAWSRAAICPCTPVNDQTEQPDPLCPLCTSNQGFLYFGPKDYAAPVEVGSLTDLQASYVVDAAIIRGVSAAITARTDPYDAFGNWVWGEQLLTVRKENRLGFWDRLVALNALQAYPDSAVVAAGQTTVPTRYKVHSVNLLRSFTRIFYQEEHFTVNTGVITWLPGNVPTTETRLSIHYLMHPTWTVVDHPHADRLITRRDTAELETPFGTPTQLPIRAKIKLQYLTDKVKG